MKRFLLPEGKGYKANLHCHTTVSDGKKTPSEIKKMYQEQGYSIVAFTDHEVLLDHADLCDEHFLALNGYETSIKEEQVSTDSRPLMRVHHINLIKRRPHDTVQVCFFPENFTPGNCASYLPFVHYTGDICRYEYSTAFVNHLIEEAHKNGFLVHYNHPHWSGQTPEDVLALSGLDGIELLNTDTYYYGDRNAAFYGELAKRGLRAYAVAGDDNHNGENDVFGCYTVIKAPSLAYEDVTGALAKGNAYASTGAEIKSLYVENGTLFVHTSPAAAIVLSSAGREHFEVKGVGGYVDRAAFPLDFSRLGGFFRVEVHTASGKAAYSRAYYPDEVIE
ncbi:MAG: hypothetical protein J6K61_05315 [Clostridia bacterium]|nr:hypothetical protein [Clostridia bacterium]